MTDFLVPIINSVVGRRRQFWSFGFTSHVVMGLGKISIMTEARR